MQALDFWKAITKDKANHLESFLAMLEENGIRFCVIDGQGVNAYVDPLVSLDLDLAVTTTQAELIESLLTKHYKVTRFPHSLNIELPDSDLRIQIQTDSRYGEFAARASRREILGLTLPVARLEDILQGKVWAIQDPDRRASKRQKDLADVARILESYPDLKAQVPADVLARLL
ncbi:MAG: nucleotidyl transferase AbiEii/AbiGii toxin family protein [Anaerolineae bacterium]|nr:nucleotidyl transferase AbiEii/AbiGii toxin family protein [Anaerolineae bacterium]